MRFFGTASWTGTSRRRIAALLAVLLIALQAPAVALGDHGGGRGVGSFLGCDRPVTPPRCTSVGDDRRHHVAFDASLSDELAAALRRSMQVAYAATNLTLIEQDRVTDATDVIVFSGDYGDNGAAGWVYCPPDAPRGLNAMGDRWCRHQEMHFNLNPRYGLFFGDDPSRDHITCHELGHTVGLRHWGNPPQTQGPAGATCMNANTPNGPTALHQFDVDHINAYPYRVAPPPRDLRLLLKPPAEMLALEPVSGMIGATQLEAPGNLAELVAGADAVIVGRVESVTAGRVFGPASRPLHYAAATVTVRELVAGSLPGPHRAEILLEVPLFAGAEALEATRSELLGTTRLLFLRNKATSAREAGLGMAAQQAEAGYYRLVTFGAEALEARGTTLVAPDDAGVLAGLAGLPFDQAVDVVRAAAE